MKYNFAAPTAALLLLCACSQKSPESVAPPPKAAAPPAAATSNPTDFPLYNGSRVVDVKHFTQTVSAQQGKSFPLMSQGAGDYAGNEVIATSSASAADLQKWLRQVEQAPPRGYAFAPEATSSLGSVREMTNRYGIDYGVFRSSDPAKRRGVIVMTLDLQRSRRSLNLALSLVDRYKALPSMMRDRIDNELKQRAGFSAGEAIEPTSPVGATIGALRELQGSNDRALVLVDVTKKGP